MSDFFATQKKVQLKLLSPLLAAWLGNQLFNITHMSNMNFKNENWSDLYYIIEGPKIETIFDKHPRKLQ